MGLPAGEVDLCSEDLGFDVDLYVTTDLQTMTAIWMGIERIAAAQSRIVFDDKREIAASMQDWLGLSPFAKEPRRVA